MASLVHQLYALGPATLPPNTKLHTELGHREFGPTPAKFPHRPLACARSSKAALASAKL